jgi:hypothetical protein
MFGLLSMKEKVFGLVSAGLLIALVAFGVFHFFQVKLLENTITDQATQIGEQQATIATQRVSIQNLTVAIDKQNKAVQDLAMASQVHSAKAQAAIVEQANISAKWIKLYTELFNSPKPAEDDCKALSIRFNQYFELRAKEAVK